MGLFSSSKKKPAQKASAKKPSVSKEVAVKNSAKETVDAELAKLEKDLRA